MKKIVAATALVALWSTVSFAAGITNSKHDLSKDNGRTIKSTNGTQICVFCHTPHNAAQSVPLWNRTGGAANTAYRLYSASTGTLAFAKGAKLEVDSLSLFCLSCHDGSITDLGSKIANKANEDTSFGGAITWSGTGGTTTTGKAMLGTNLTNDHPIGFTYPDATAIATDKNRLFVAATVVSNFNATTAAGAESTTVFFKSANGANQMECSSCHLVHNPVNSFFLRTNNSGSKLCLACHNK